MSTVLLIARDELRLMVRNRVALIAFGLLVLLTLAAVASAWSHQRHAADLRARHQSTAQEAFDAQPDRHPHRVVHYGHFIYRPLSPLAAFDPGVDAFTGSSLFLEGHRQNTANFGDVRQSSLLVRFGQLTPAFVLQTVAPLLLVFLGYGALSRETERGTLRVLLLQGVRRSQVVGGKLVALGAVTLLAGLPAMIGFALIAGQPGASALPMAVTAAGYGAYLALWAVLVVFVSARSSRSRTALMGLVGFWALTVILLPRLAPDVANAVVPLESRLQTDIAIGRDLRRAGDSHDANDPHFAAFKQSVLDRYGVDRIEDLPFNYKGLQAVEGERLTSALFERYAGDAYAAQRRQNDIVRTASLFSPAIALRSMSMAAAGTDLAAHQRFLSQAEAYRFDLVQRLNRLQAENVSYADDTAPDPDADRRKRIAAHNWRQMPEFSYRPASASDLTRAALPGLLVILGWLGLASLLLSMAARRLGDR
jgi:ABC-2 type transport system permease protein